VLQVDVLLALQPLKVVEVGGLQQHVNAVRQGRGQVDFVEVED